MFNNMLKLVIIISTRLIAFFVLLCCSYQVVGQQILINEFMSSNDTTIEDSFGNNSDWIELFNNSNSSINLEGFFLSDDKNDLEKWTFPSIEIPAKGFLLIFASGENLHNLIELHTNFKISKDGESLYLSNQNKQIIDSTISISLESDNSYGRFIDGNLDWIVFDFSTPGESNSKSKIIVSNYESGFYTKGFNLELFCQDANSAIYYTLDGTDPTLASIKYEQPIPILNMEDKPQNLSNIPTTPLSGLDGLDDYIWKQPEGRVKKANVIKYRSYQNQQAQSKVYCKTYFDCSLTTNYKFPVVSIVTDSLNLFDYDTGIYIPGISYDEHDISEWWLSGNYRERGEEWERKVHFEFFDTKNDLSIATYAGMRMHGWSSASYPQKSFRLYFRKLYGQSKIDYQLFHNSETTKFDRLIFRNSGNDFLLTHFKDAFLQDLLKDLDLELQNFLPTNVFINGEYWGIHNIRERYDKCYFENHFNVPEDSLLFAGVCGNLIVGTSYDYLKMEYYINNNEINSLESYQHFNEIIDLQNFYDYHIAQVYYGNNDWPCTNFRMWKTIAPGSKWRWLIYDLDEGFVINEKKSYDFRSLEFATEEGVLYWPNCDCSTFIFRSLLKNDSIKNQFVNRFAYHLNNTFDTRVVLNKIDSFHTLYKSEMVEHIERWLYPAEHYEWENNIDILREFAIKRPCAMREQIIEFFNLESFGFVCNESDSAFRKKAELILYPNPCNGIVTMFYHRYSNVKGNVRVYNNCGQPVLSANIDVIDNKVLFDFNNLPSGIYFMKVNILDENLSGRFMIVK